MATTLQEYAQNRSNELEAVIDQTRAAWRTAIGEETTARADLAAKRDELVAAESELAAIRRGLAASSTPGEAEELSAQLRTKLLEARGLRAERVILDEDLALATAERVRLKSRLASVESELAEAERALAEETEENAKRSALKIAATGDELTALAARAQALIDAAQTGAPTAAEEDSDGTLAQAARDRIEGDIPAALLPHVRARAAAAKGASEAQAQLAEELLDAIDAHRAAAMGLEGAVEPLETQFDRAVEALTAFAIGAPSRLESALALLGRVRDSEPLSDEERTNIEDEDLAAAVIDTDALVHDAAVTSARVDLTDSEAAVEQAIAEALIADVYADPEVDAGVIGARAAFGTAETDLDSAEGVLSSSERASFDAWEVEIPDRLWTNLAAYDQAFDLLGAIVDTDRAALGTDLDAAEAPLAQALEDADKAWLADDRVSALVEAAATRASVLANTAPARALIAARGDS